MIEMLQKSSYQTNITEQRTTYYGIYKYERLSLLCLPFSIGKGKRIAVITPVFRLSVVKQQKNYQRHCCGIIFSERSVFFIFQQCRTEVGNLFTIKSRRNCALSQAGRKIN